MSLQERLAALSVAFDARTTADGQTDLPEPVAICIADIQHRLKDSNLASPGENVEIEALELILGIKPTSDSVIWGD